ncbi:MAG: hypothetical protein JWP00_4718 [Chloroflexi bacterium]|nr:hypothetical protein [Chloroflexota bacterium]
MNEIPVEDTPGNRSLEISPAQQAQLENLLELVKTIGSTDQLILLGLLAAHANEIVLVSDLIPALPHKINSNLPRHLRQLEKAGFLEIQEWQAPAPGREPAPTRLHFNPNYSKQAQAMLAALRQVVSLTQAAGPAEVDERAVTISRFMKDGKITAMPVQLKRQQFILEEVSKIFENGIRYTERQIDAILKEVYEYDYCTLRRYLVDFKFLNRAEGIYWKNSPVLGPV